MTQAQAQASLAGLGIDFSRRPKHKDILNPPSPAAAQPPHSRQSSMDGTTSLGFSSARSNMSMRGLLQAENGEAMVQFDDSGGGSAFKAGSRILPQDLESTSLLASQLARTDESAEHAPLSRHGTLLTAGASTARNASELKAILGNSNARLKSRAQVPLSYAYTSNGDKTSLEQAKPRARVEVDIILDNKTCVESGYLRGHVKVRIRKRTKKESPVLISGGKVRVVGFECIGGHDERYTFYHTSTMLEEISRDHMAMYASPPDEEGFYLAREGVYIFPFAMELPLDEGPSKPKGMLQLQSGPTVRYIAMFSLKVKEEETGKRSIAHFYRDCEIWPRHNPSIVLTPASAPIRNIATKGIFMGGSGKVTLSAEIHRLHWVAGQQCCVSAHVVNWTKKTIKRLTITLLRRVVVFQPKAHLDVGTFNKDLDMDACETSTSEKEVAGSVLQMGQRGTRGHASAKGWWTGVPPGVEQDVTHFIQLPLDALTVPRGRLIEVEYGLKVAVAAGPLGSEVEVTLPIKIISFLSIDPPPSYPLPVKRPIGAVHESEVLQALEEESYEEEELDEGIEFCEESDAYDGITSEESDSEFSISVDNAYDGLCPASETSSTSDRQQPGSPLANFTVADDADGEDEVVRHAITSARIDATYGERGNRFADLYYAEHPSAIRGAIGTGCQEDTVEAGGDDEELLGRTPRQSVDDPDLQAIPLGPRASFARRVQEKLRAVEEEKKLTRHDSKTGVQHDVASATSSTDSSPPSEGSYFRPRGEMPHEVEKSPPVGQAASTRSEVSTRSKSRCSAASAPSISTSEAGPLEAADVAEQKDSDGGPAENLKRPSLEKAARATGRARGKSVSEAAAVFEKKLLESGSSPAPSTKKAVTPFPLMTAPAPSVDSTACPEMLKDPVHSHASSHRSSDGESFATAPSRSSSPTKVSALAALEARMIPETKPASAVAGAQLSVKAKIQQLEQKAQDT